MAQYMHDYADDTTYLIFVSLLDFIFNTMGTEGSHDLMEQSCFASVHLKLVTIEYEEIDETVLE